jgi:hypothetical protein
MRCRRRRFFPRATWGRCCVCASSLDGAESVRGRRDDPDRQQPAGTIDAIKDGLANLVIVLGFGLDIFRRRMKRFATRAFGDIRAIVDFSPEFLLKCYRTNQANSNPLTSRELSTSRARSLSRMTGINDCFTRLFLASMPGSFVSSRQKTQIEAIRLFRAYTSSKNGGVRRGLSIFSRIKFGFKEPGHFT